MSREETRLFILSEFEKISKQYEKIMDILDVWQVIYVVRNKMGELDFNYAYFNSRYDAEYWLSSRVKDLPYYAYCCDNTVWNNIDELLGE